MHYWLVKTEPSTYAWEDLVKDKKTFWDGVRNYAARNNMQAMQKGDLVFVYHSVKERTIVGIAKVIKEAYQDPTTKDDRWVVVDIQAVKAVTTPVSLDDIKKVRELSNMVLVNNSRLSVQPVAAKEWQVLLAMSNTTL